MHAVQSTCNVACTHKLTRNKISANFGMLCLFFMRVFTVTTYVASKTGATPLVLSQASLQVRATLHVVGAVYSTHSIVIVTMTLI